MEFREIYRGVTVNVRYDPNTLTFQGNLTGLGHPVSVQAETYDDLQDACMKAIDDALITDDRSIADYAHEWHRSQAATTAVPVKGIESRVLPGAQAATTAAPVETTETRAALGAQAPRDDADDDPFSRRRFLR